MRIHKLAVSATFTAEPLADVLAFWNEQLCLGLDVRFGQYNQVFQDLLLGEGLLATNDVGVNLVLFRPEDWQRYEGGVDAWEIEPDKVERRLTQTCEELCDAIVAAAECHSTHYLVACCPGSPAARAVSRRACFLGALERSVQARLDHCDSIQVLPMDAVQELYPVKSMLDPYRDEMGHIPYTKQFFVALGTFVSRSIAGLVHPRRKVVAVDCDYTLWKGAVAELGPRGIEIDPFRKALQSQLAQLVAGGVLVCLVSKNVEQDVLSVWDVRSDMPLDRRHWVSARINWEPKSSNLVSLSAELGLALSSFVFIDDNPMECAEVEASCPEVLVLQLPADQAEIPVFLRHVWALDANPSTDEDRKRAQLYRENQHRNALRERVATVDDFLAGLQLSVDIAPPQPEELARVAQLTQRTNQFNCTTRRHTVAEIRSRCLGANQEWCAAVHVKDRFGDYGLVGVVGGGAEREALVVDTFLLSCRVLGRTVENHMLRYLGKMALEQSLVRVDVNFRSSSRNQPARAFLDRAAGGWQQPGDEETWVYRIPADRAAATPLTVWSSDGLSTAEPAPQSLDAGEVSHTRALQHVHRNLRDVDAISRAIEQVRAAKAAGRSQPALEEASAGWSDLQITVAGVWTRVLAMERVGLEEDFFELGGTSLQAVDVLGQIRDQLGVRLSIEHFLDARTLAAFTEAVVVELEKEGSVDGSA